MAPLHTLRAKTLQRIAFLTGLPSTGTKVELSELLRCRLPNGRLPNEKARIISIDMGIRNLAFCVLDVPDSKAALSSASTKSPVQVRDWKRLDLLDRLIAGGVHGGQLDATTKAPVKLPSHAFTPSIMSKTAYSITTELLKYQPTTILVERQRFRSGGGPAILEWTLRVNMLESMLWACFETHNKLRAFDNAYNAPSIYEVSPATVAKFWTAGEDKLLRTSDRLLSAEGAEAGSLTALNVSSRSVDKQAKIAVARSWLEGEGGVSMKLDSGLHPLADAFTGTTRPTKDGKVSIGTEYGAGRVGKLDDLADCLLQGAAWVRWEANRRSMLSILSDAGYVLSP